MQLRARYRTLGASLRRTFPICKAVYPSALRSRTPDRVGHRQELSFSGRKSLPLIEIRGTGSGGFDALNIAGDICAGALLSRRILAQAGGKFNFMSADGTMTLNPRDGRRHPIRRGGGLDYAPDGDEEAVSSAQGNMGWRL